METLVIVALFFIIYALWKTYSSKRKLKKNLAIMDIQEHVFIIMSYSEAIGKAQKTDLITISDYGNSRNDSLLKINERLNDLRSM